MKHLLAVALLMLGICSCDKNDLPAPSPVTSNKISKISTDDGEVSYTYNADGTVQRSDLIETGTSIPEVYLYSYEGGKIKQCSADGYLIKYTYSNTGSVTVTIENLISQVLYAQTYTMDGDKLMELVHSVMVNGNLRPYFKLVNSYNGSGNIIKTDHFNYTNSGWIKVETIEVVEYDNKPNYSSMHELAPFIIMNKHVLKNNPIKINYIDETGAVYKTETNQITYDASGRKTKVVTTTKNVGGPDEVYTANYTY